MSKKRFALATVGFVVMTSGTVNATIISIGTGTAVMGNHGSNLVTNGSFENRLPGDPAVPTNLSWSGVDGFHIGNPNQVVYTIPDWSETSDSGAYGVWGSSFGPCADGVACLYFGNWYTTPSTPPTFHGDGTVTFAPPPTFTNKSSKNQTPTTLSQTLILTIGDTYLLDFYTTGEENIHGYIKPGVFGLSIGADSVFLTVPSSSSLFNAGSIRYYVEFTATAATETLSFTNWGHIGDLSTELVLDDVIVERVPEPATLALVGTGMAGLCAMRRRRPTRR